MAKEANWFAITLVDATNNVSPDPTDEIQKNKQKYQ